MQSRSFGASHCRKHLRVFMRTPNDCEKVRGRLSFVFFQGSVPPRYINIKDLLVTLIPMMYIKRPKNDEKPALERVKVPSYEEILGGAVLVLLNVCYSCCSGQHILPFPIDNINRVIHGLAFQFSHAIWRSRKTSLKII